MILPRLGSSLLSSFLFLFSSALGGEKSSEIKIETILTVSEKGPILHQTLCGEEAFGTGYFSFFHPDGKTLCARGSLLYPAMTVIVIPRSTAPVTLPPPWRLVDGYDRVLLYDETAPFAEGSDETGTVLSLIPPGYYTDSSGTVRTPRFIRRKEAWEAVVPLREFFLLTVGSDNRFTVDIGSLADLSDAPKNPLRFFGIAAESAVMHTHKDRVMIIEGNGFSGVRIPRIRLVSAKDAFGRYLIEIRDPRRSLAKKSASIDTGTLIARYEQGPEGTIRFECQVLRETLSQNDAMKLESFMKRNLPLQYEVKKR